MEGFSKRAQAWGNSFDKYKKSAGESTTGNNTLINSQNKFIQKG